MLALGYIQLPTGEESHDRGPSWQRTIRHDWHEIATLLTESPSLRDYPARQLAAAYRCAREVTVDETGLPAWLA
jgi:hypothetical protein